jgi:hypothetical protein
MSWTHCHLLSVSSQSDLYSHITIVLNIVRPTALTVSSLRPSAHLVLKKLHLTKLSLYSLSNEMYWLHWQHCFV